MFYFPHQGLRWQLLIVLHCHIIMGGYEGQSGRLPFIQINYQPYFANRNWRSLRKNSGRLSSSLSPSQTCFFPVNGSYSAIGNIGSLNSGKRVGADDNYHWPLKCAHMEEYRWSSLPWSGMQVKTNKITIETESMGVVLLGRHPPPRHAFCFRHLRVQAGAGWTKHCCPRN